MSLVDVSFSLKILDSDNNATVVSDVVVVVARPEDKVKAGIDFVLGNSVDIV